MWTWIRDNLLRSPETLAFAAEIDRLRAEREPIARQALIRAAQAAARGER